MLMRFPGTCCVTMLVEYGLLGCVLTAASLVAAATVA